MDIRELIAETVGGVPQATAGRCVHERVGVATCRCCETACPRGAWQLDDEDLMIDIGQCDGCGLCVAACPEGALSQAGVSPDRHAGAAELRLSCERADTDAGDWQLPCVHAVGLAWLAGLYRAGLRTIGLHVGDCRTCERRTDAALTDAVARLNQVLMQRKLPQIDVHASDARPGREPDKDCQGQGGPLLSRRGFFRRMVRATAAPEPDPPGAAWAPPGSRLPTAQRGDLALFVPEIDVRRCNGCDACVRVCGHAALTCEHNASDAYRIAADACTGCGLCVDICDRDAVSVNQAAVVSQTEVALVVGTCRVCGVRFHTPDTGCDGDTLCQICSRVDHKRNLYQVL